MIHLTKENFNEIFYRTTGIRYFPNPFDYEGKERCDIKKKALWHIAFAYERDDVGKLGFFTDDGTFTESTQWLLSIEDGFEILYNIIISELEEYLISEDDGCYISF